jgi:hypothetical protein
MPRQLEAQWASPTCHASHPLVRRTLTWALSDGRTPVPSCKTTDPGAAAGLVPVRARSGKPLLPHAASLPISIRCSDPTHHRPHPRARRPRRRSRDVAVSHRMWWPRRQPAIKKWKYINIPHSRCRSRKQYPAGIYIKHIYYFLLENSTMPPENDTSEKIRATRCDWLGEAPPWRPGPTPLSYLRGAPRSSGRV